MYTYILNIRQSVEQSKTKIKYLQQRQRKQICFFFWRKTYIICNNIYDFTSSETEWKKWKYTYVYFNARMLFEMQSNVWRVLTKKKLRNSSSSPPPLVFNHYVCFFARIDFQFQCIITNLDKNSSTHTHTHTSRVNICMLDVYLLRES